VGQQKLADINSRSRAQKDAIATFAALQKSLKEFLEVKTDIINPLAPPKAFGAVQQLEQSDRTVGLSLVPKRDELWNIAVFSSSEADEMSPK
jgi:hypothetical protein